MAANVPIPGKAAAEPTAAPLAITAAITDAAVSAAPGRTSPTGTPPPSTGTTWVAGHAYRAGDTVTYAGTGYRCLQAHTSMYGWEPPAAPALWQRL